MSGNLDLTILKTRIMRLIQSNKKLTGYEILKELGIQPTDRRVVSQIRTCLDELISEEKVGEI